MIRHFQMTLLLIVTVLTTGCAKKKLPAPDAPLAERISGPTLSLIEAAGDKASLVVVLNPQRFRKASRTLKPLLSDLKAKWKEDALEEKDVFSSAARGAGMSFSKLKLLRAWDRSRPIVAGLFEPQVGDLMLAARAVIPIGLEGLKMGYPGMRHRVLVPARNPLALSEVFAEMAASRNLEPLQKASSLPALKGGSLYMFPGGNGFLALVPEEDHVRCEILTDDFQPELDEDQRLEHYAKLITSVSRGRLPLTPALVSAANRPDLLLVHVRPWQFRDLGNQINVLQVYQAVIQASGDWGMSLLAQGLAEVATGYLLMTPVGAEMDDVTIGLDVESGLRLSFTGSLTDRGQAIFQAGLEKAGNPPRPVHTPLVLSAWSGLDIGAMLRAAPTPAAFEGPDRKKDVTMQLMVCGYFCYLHYLFRNPFGLIKTALEVTSPNAFDRLPRGFGFAVTEIAGKQASGPPARIAAAALFPGATDLGFIKNAFIYSHPEDAIRLKVDIDVKPQGENQLMLFGLAADPGQVFGQTEAPSAPGLIGELELNLQEAARGFGFETHSPEVYALMGKLEQLRLRSMFGGRSVQGELIVSLKGEKPLAFGEVLDTSGLSWESPGAREADTKGRKCLARHTRKMIEAYSALAAVSENYKVPVLQAAFAECKPSLDCALGEPDTRDEAQRMKFAQKLYLAGRMGENFMPERKLELLDQACKEGSREACELAKEAREKPDVRLVRTDAACLPERQGGYPVISIDAGKDPVDPGPESREIPRLAVDQAVTWERFQGVIDKLTARGHRKVLILVRNSKDQVRQMPLKLPEMDDEPRKRPPLRIGNGPEGMCYVAEGHDAVRTYKNVEALAEDLNAVVKREGVVTDMEFTSVPEASFDHAARVLAATTCAQGKEIDYVVSLARPVSGLLKNLSGTGGTLQDVLKDAGVNSPTAGFGGFEHLRGKKRPIVKSKPPIVGDSMVKPMIRKVISKARPKIRNCYERCLLKDPDLEGTVKVHFVVGSTGRVEEAKITRNTSGNKDLADCLLARVKQLKFPKPTPGGKMVVDYPFVFKSKKPKKKK